MENQEGTLRTGLGNTRQPPFQSTGHSINVDCFSIMGREVYSVIKTIKEVMLIWVNDPSLSRNLLSTSCPTSGMRSYRTPQPSTQVTLCHQLTMGQLLPWHILGIHTHILHISKYGSPCRGASTPFLAPVSVEHKLVPSIVSMFW